MRLSKRSFPHPVVGNADDVPGAEFQATLEFESDRSTFYLSATVECSSPSLLKLIKKGAACYCLHVECGNTLYRRIFDFREKTYKVSIPESLIHDSVEVNAFVRAVTAVQGYRVDGAHPDYDDAVFDVRPGDVLAVGDGQVFDARHDVDPLRRIGALMVVVRSEEPGLFPMEADFSPPDRIHVRLCEEDFAAYAAMKNTEHLTSHLTTTLVLPVLMQALTLLDGDDDASRTRWAELLRQKVEESGLGNADPLEKAQRLLDLPIRRALAAALTYSEPQGS